MRTQQFANGLAPTDSTEAVRSRCCSPALSAHLAYAETVARFPAQPRASRAPVRRSDRTSRGRATCIHESRGRRTTLPVIYMTRLRRRRAARGRAVTEPTPIAARRDAWSISLRCSWVSARRSTRPRAMLRAVLVEGVAACVGRRSSEWLHQCGDDANGDPSRASGVYAFSGPTYPGQSRLVRLTGQAAIDESSSSSQRGSSVTWTVLYDGRPMCSTTVVWSGPRPLPRRLDCKIPAAASSGGLDVGRLRIQQVASLASSGSLWAGLLDPRIVVEPL